MNLAEQDKWYGSPFLTKSISTTSLLSSVLTCSNVTTSDMTATQVRTKQTHNKGLAKLLLPVSYYVAASSVNIMFLREFEGAKQQLR